jgi:threonine dehydratase
MKPLLKGKRVGVLISGGNVDIERFCSLLAAFASAPTNG